MILAIDTSTKTATAALLDENRILAEYSVVSEKNHSKAVLPMIEAMLNRLDKSTSSELDYIVCTVGPGSFTGLRIGASVAKAFAFALNKKIVPVSSLDVSAYNVLTADAVICPMLDARGSCVYTAFYTYDGASMNRISDYMTVSLEKAVELLKSHGEPVFFTGGGAAAYRAELLLLIEEKGISARFAPEHLNVHRAGVLGVYAFDNRDKLTAVSGSEFKLMYMSRSQAEAGR